MKTYKHLYQQLCSEENLYSAFLKARKRKSNRKDVKDFEERLEQNLSELRTALLLHYYTPKPLSTFIIRDPKTRKIRKSAFRDRIVHHAICNILEPIFDKTFIYDSFANRKGKGTLNAIKRFDTFKRKVSKNNTINCFVLKADISHYFDEVNHTILLNIIKEKVSDKQLIWLIKKVLNNHSYDRGMPLGNMTSQFFANVYLNQLDYFVKHELKAKYYLRYVDDFIILLDKKEELEAFKRKITLFLKESLQLELHPFKSKIISLNQGVPFLGFRNYNYYRLLKKTNIRNMQNKIAGYDYDCISEFLEGWFAYANQANTYNLRKTIRYNLEERFSGEMSTSYTNRLINLIEVH